MSDYKKKEIKIGDLDLKSKVVKVNRVTKIETGGSVLSFNAGVIVGDRSNVVGYGFGKALEPIKAIEKATRNARYTLMKVPIIHGTIPHPITCKYKATTILLKPAPPGTGIRAGGPAYDVLFFSGLTDVVCKVKKSNNPFNVVRATMKALGLLRDAWTVARQRGIPLEKVFNG
ncbi:MAG: 30S ribosomal protein S5 [Cytophagales bacterium]